MWRRFSWMQGEEENIFACANESDNVSSLCPSFIPWMPPWCRVGVTCAVPLLRAGGQVSWGADGISKCVSSYPQLLPHQSHGQCDSVQAQLEICVWLSRAAHPFGSGGLCCRIVAKIIKGHTSLTGIGHGCLFYKHHWMCRKKNILDTWGWWPVGPEWVGGSSEKP